MLVIEGHCTGHSIDLPRCTVCLLPLVLVASRHRNEAHGLHHTQIATAVLHILAGGIVRYYFISTLTRAFFVLLEYTAGVEQKHLAGFFERPLASICLNCIGTLYRVIGSLENVAVVAEVHYRIPEMREFVSFSAELVLLADTANRYIKDVFVGERKW